MEPITLDHPFWTYTNIFTKYSLQGTQTDAHNRSDLFSADNTSVLRNLLNCIPYFQNRYFRLRNPFSQKRVCSLNAAPVVNLFKDRLFKFESGPSKNRFKIHNTIG